MRHRLFVHVTWTTRERAPLIDAPVAQFLGRFLRAIAQQERSRIVELGIVQTHVHVLLRIHPTTNIPRLLQRLKGGSGVIANREGHTGTNDLKWAKGYNIESVSMRAVPLVRECVHSQPRHHPTEAIAGWSGMAPPRVSFEALRRSVEQASPVQQASLER